MLERRGAALEGEAGEAAAAECRVCALCGSEFKIMGLYNRFCKFFFAAVIIRLTAQSDSRALVEMMFGLWFSLKVHGLQIGKSPFYSLQPLPIGRRVIQLH